jgi:hypothetical protein
MIAIFGSLILGASALVADECEICINDARVLGAALTPDGRIEMSLAPVRSTRGGRVRDQILEVTGYAATGEIVGEIHVALRRNQRFAAITAPDGASKWVVELSHR